MLAHRFCVAILLMAITRQLTLAQILLPTNQSPDAGKQSCYERSMSESESKDCFDKAYRDAEARLIATYSQAIERLTKALAWARVSKNPEKLANHQAALDKLRAAQTAWKTYRRLHCESLAYEYPSATINYATRSQCMAEVTEARISIIENNYYNGPLVLDGPPVSKHQPDEITPPDLQNSPNLR